MNRSLVFALGLAVVVAGSSAGQIQKKKDEVPRYIMNLTAKDAKDRIAACQNISAVGQVKAAFTKSAVEPLCEVVKKDADPKVRAEAATALGLISPDPKKAAPVLTAAVKNDKDDGVKMAAIMSLGELGSGAEEAMPVLKEIFDRYRVDQDKARQEREAFFKAGEKDKANMAQGREQAAGRWTQAAGEAMRSISAK